MYIIIFYYLMLYRLSLSILFFFNDTATTEIYTLSLHDALPISFGSTGLVTRSCTRRMTRLWMKTRRSAATPRQTRRSEEHTSELQSHLNLVCRLLLEKKKKKIIYRI